MNNEQTEKVISAFQSHPEVKLAYFFGSRAKNEEGPMSDYDFAVYLDEKDKKKVFETKFVLMDEISRLIGTDKIDIVVLDITENPEIKFFIIKEGKLIFEREAHYRVLVEPRIMNEYFDFYSMLRRHELTKA